MSWLPTLVRVTFVALLEFARRQGSYNYKRPIGRHITWAQPDGPFRGTNM